MSTWHYIQNGERKGPLEEVKLKELLSSQVLSPEVKVWSEGMSEWVEARSLSPFNFIEDFPPPLPEEAPPPEPESVSTSSGNILPYGFYITLEKFVILSIASCGLYPHYWVYRNYKYFNDRDNLNISPIARAFFAIFYMPNLLQRIKHDLKEKNLGTPTYDPILLGLIWSIASVLLSIISLRLYSMIQHLVIDIISLGLVCLLLPAHKEIVETNQLQGIRTTQDEWTTGQVILMVLGAISWYLTFVP